MYTIITIFVIFVVATLINLLINGEYTKAEYFCIPFAIALVVLIASILIMTGISDSYIENNKEDFVFVSDVIYTQNIKSLNDNFNNINASFVLGSGIISNTSRFYFYTQISDSSYKLSSLPSNDVTIIESDYKRPCIIRYDKHIDWAKSDVLNWLLKVYKGSDYYVIYVPKNTIIANYNLDTK